MTIKITVFTPSYNRCNTLGRVFSSLVRQTNHRFEWLIIDDGSTDDTASLVNSLAKQTTKFRIRYVYKSNGGKHSTYEYCGRFAKYEFFIPLDSDDELFPWTIEKCYEYLEQLSRRVDKNSIAGLIGNAVNDSGSIEGKVFDKNIILHDFGRLILRSNFGDHFEIYRTCLLKEFSFPKAGPELYIPESYLYHKISRSYKILTAGEILVMKWQDKRDDHLNDRLARPENAEGRRLAYDSIVQNSSRLLFYRPLTILSIAHTLVLMDREKGINYNERIRGFKEFLPKLVYILATLIAIGY
jgi:glycosyltransferase involved in cell wall biosynthesis